jgi:uncharacterized protein
MFAPYEIEYEGRRYFGNVSLREFHIFDYDGNAYLVDVESLTARPVSPRLAVMIGHAASACGGLVPASVVEALRGLKLIEGLDDDRPETPPEVAPGSEAKAAPGKAEFPIANMALFLAQECNMRCVYCYGDGGGYAGEGLMSEETALRAVDWLMENSGSAPKVNIGFFGGEPLLNFTLMRKIVPYARQKAQEKGKKLTFGMTTNGSLLSDEVITFIKDAEVQSLISFDGPPEVQNRQRPFKDGSGSYDRVHANVQKLREAVPHLSARATVYGDADPCMIKEGMARAGFATCYLALASPVLLNAPGTGPAPDGQSETMTQRMLAYNRKEIDELLAAIREKSIVKDSPPAMLSLMAEIISGQKRYYGCGVGKGMAAVSVTGDIYPCHRFAGLADMRLGNVADYRAGKLNDYHRAVVDHLPECRGCWARYYCGGGCSYHNKATTGDMHRPDVLACREKKAMFEGLIHVYCNLSEADREYVKEILKDLRQEDRRP